MSNDILPERINVMRVISYDVEDIIDELTAEGYNDSISLDVIMGKVENWARDEFQVSLKELIFQDENGEEL